MFALSPAQLDLDSVVAKQWCVAFKPWLYLGRTKTLQLTQHYHPNDVVLIVYMGTQYRVLADSRYSQFLLAIELQALDSTSKLKLILFKSSTSRLGFRRLTRIIKQVQYAKLPA